MLAALMGFDYADERSRNAWELHHLSDHDDIRKAIEDQKGVNLEAWQIYPTNWKDWDAYALRHQSLHNDMNAVLGLDSVDLTSVDFKDKKASEDWNFEHYREHLAARTVLGI